MRILYVTSFWTAFRDMLLVDGDSSKGMPGFINTVKALKKDGHEIDFLLISTDPEDANIMTKDFVTSYVNKEDIKEIIIYKPKARIKKIVGLMNLYSEVKKTTERLVSEEEYDFVYAQSSFAMPASKVAYEKDIPCGHRLYGSFVYGYYKKNGFLRTLFFEPFEILSYYLPKSFMLITDDGSNGAKALELFNKRKKRYDFYFWRNGVDRIDSTHKSIIKNSRFHLEHPSIFYFGRIAQWKRQDRAIEVIKLLKDKGLNSQLYLAGQIAANDEGYYKEIMQKASRLGVEEQVKYIGTITREEANYMAKNSDVSLLLYDVTNMGNVFHELLADGAVIIALNDGTLNDYLVNGDNGYLVNDEAEAAEIIAELISNQDNGKVIRENAINKSKQSMKSWGDRVFDEIEIIKKAVRKSHDSR